MTSPPRRAARLFDRPAWLALGLIGLLVGAATMTAFAVGRTIDGETAQTMAFATLALSELALVFAIRSVGTPAWRLPRNGGLLASVAASAALVAALVYLPLAHEPSQTVSLGVAPAVLVLALALTPFALLEVAKTLVRRRRPAAGAAAP